MSIENKKQFATILLAIGLGLVAAMLMSKVVNDKVDQQTSVIAKDFQIKSTKLVKEMDGTRNALKKLTQEHAALAKRVAQQPKVVQVQTPTDTKKRTVQNATFSLRTPPGKRAITIAIDSLYAVGGLLNPGDFIDIIAQLAVPVSPLRSNKKGASSEKVTTVLFQNIQVLAVGTNFDPRGVIPPYEMQQGARKLNVTLAVSPEEAGLLTFAEAKGRLRFSLRSPEEMHDKVLQEVASWNSLADFVLKMQGTELKVPETKTKVVVDDNEEEVEGEPKPSIQIFRGGREL